MPRRLRVENCGYHHVYNRGVAKNSIFLDEYDKVKFIEILSSVCKEYKFDIHSFCLMDNHYHLLVENRRENLSAGMRQLNSGYASYFNKRHQRVGHLWQDRYKSWYVLDETYLFTLFRYIESNPLKAKMCKKIGEYKYCATYCIKRDAVPPFLQNSFVLRDYHTGELFDMLDIPLNPNELENIGKFHQQRYKLEEGQIVHVKQKSLEQYFLHVKDKTQRDEAIKSAHEDGYKKSEIGRALGLSGAGIAKILKKFRV
ncbi:transposase [Sulfurospirillum sp. T05]|uniref:Transposase n=1 Tax=Sulfurospirillum tamanense TaxID=2813362 RepID=A0ABS2WUJ8_9BACT|nr:transposase [Sulfurospirillum tamanensis]MBN2965337.1 transposase [Sulfurospirillum tamanensis]